MSQRCRDRAVHFNDRVVTLVKFEQPPLRRRPVQIRHALPHQRRHPAGTNNQSPRRNGCPTREFAAFRQTSSHRIPNVSAASIDGLRLGTIHSQNRECALSLRIDAARIDRTERFLQVDARGQPRDREFRKCLSVPAAALLIERARATFFADGERRSRSRQISSFVGRVWPIRCTASRSVPPLPRHRARAAPYFAPPTTDGAGTCCARPKSSTSTVPDRKPLPHLRAQQRPKTRADSPVTVRSSVSGVMPPLAHNRTPKSVTGDHPQDVERLCENTRKKTRFRNSHAPSVISVFAAGFAM